MIPVSIVRIYHYIKYLSKLYKLVIIIYGSTKVTYYLIERYIKSPYIRKNKGNVLPI